MSKVLIIDDEAQIRSLLARMLQLEGYEVAQAGDCRSALRQIETQQPDVALCDVFLPDGNGVELTAAIKKARPATEVILLTAHGNIPDGVQAIKNGAFDYITKGDDNNRIIPLVSQAAEKAKAGAKANPQGKAKSKAAGQQTYTFETIIGESSSIKNSVNLARKVAGTDVPVLLTGETGTGKEVFAQAIHSASRRSEKAFVAVNCSAFSRELLESEMFGHKAGAFTGATKDKKGLFEEADGGTLFLDEVGEMALELQAKFLRVLETGECLRVGDTRPIHIDVRIIAATNRDLRQEIEKGNFREDLFYRLSVFSIQLPPLRERPGDVKLLAKNFVMKLAPAMGCQVGGVSKDCLDVLEAQPWRGNIRELRNTIERSLIVCEGDELKTEDLPLEFQEVHNDPAQAGSAGSLDLASMERRHIARVLSYTHGNKTETARLLKIGLTTLYRKIEQYGLAVE